MDPGDVTESGGDIDGDDDDDDDDVEEEEEEEDVDDDEFLRLCGRTAR
jgi:hypothetical protein